MEKNYFGIMVDCSRNAVMSVCALKRLIDALSKMGYNMLMLYTEDTYEVDGQAKFGYLRGRYTKEEINELVAYGEERGIELIPCIQTLAHLNQIFRWNEYKQINDCKDILLAEDERTYKLIDDMLSTLRQYYSTNVIHIGMDEAHSLGRGKYRDLHGDVDRFGILSRHLEKVTQIAKKYGFDPIMWSDMFFRLATGGRYYSDSPSVITPEISACVPRDVGLVYWDYYRDDRSEYDNMIEAHKRFDSDIWFAGGAWTWTGFTPHNNLSIKRTEKAMASCRDNGIKNIFITCWGDDGGEASVFSVLPTLFWGAEVYRGNEDPTLIKKKFKETFNVAFDDFMKLDLPCTPIDEYKNKMCNPDRVLLYNDLFLGVYDPTIARFEGIEKTYEQYAKDLSALSCVEGFGYLFDSAAALCDVLAVKSTLGVRLRDAYQRNDREELSRLISDITLCEKKLEAFYLSYRREWLLDKKGSGFEIQNIRLGGVRQRLVDCRLRIEEYLRGETDSIEELEQTLLEVHKELNGSSWRGIVSTSVLSFGLIG